MTASRPIKEIGWKDKIDLPDFGLENIDVKIDTGAKTSVLHCSYIEKIEGKKNMVKFIPLSNEFEGYSGEVFIKKYHEERKIKNSFGDEENRFIIKSMIQISGKKFYAFFSLRDRSAMEFPILLGRDTIRKHFLVNVSKSNIYYKKKIKRIKNTQSRDLK